MIKIKKHISIPSDIDIMILDYARKCNISFSEAIVQLVSSGINNQEMAKEFEKNNALLDKLYSKAYYFTALLEQMYSDFEWEKLLIQMKVKHWISLNQNLANINTMIKEVNLYA